MTISIAPKPQLYDRDYALWIEATIAQLGAGNFAEVDRDNLIEELADMGRRERLSLESNVVVILLHLLKWEFQPEMRSGSWRGSITEHRQRVRRGLKTSPSLNNHLLAVIAECYEDARELAAAETGLPINVFPVVCPYSLAEIRDRTFWPGVADRHGVDEREGC